MDPIGALDRVAFLLEFLDEPTFKVRAFRRAIETLAPIPPEQIERLARTGRLKDLPGIGDATARIVAEALAGTVPGYLERLEGVAVERTPLDGAGLVLRQALRGDCHVHSDWSDGGSPIDVMARAAASLGHGYMVLSDHSPRLTVARGLSRARLEEQIGVVDGLNAELAPFRILAGIEVDILDDGGLDQDDDLLARLDIVVGSVHSKLRMPGREMTARMLRAVANPHLDILGHCTGRMKSGGKDRPESEFDAAAVFAACAAYDKAVEINCRPERLDPPRRLIRLALESGCRFSVDSDAHAPGQLGWLSYGCARAAECGVPPGRVVNTMAVEELLGWAGGR